MTKREAAIVTAYTDMLIGKIDEVYEYLGELVGRPIYTHEIPWAMDKYRDKIKQDFISLEVI